MNKNKFFYLELHHLLGILISKLIVYKEVKKIFPYKPHLKVLFNSHEMRKTKGRKPSEDMLASLRNQMTEANDNVLTEACGPNGPPEAEQRSENSECSDMPRKKRSIHCSTCNQEGHNRSSCSDGQQGSDQDHPTWKAYCEILEENRALRIRIAELERQPAPEVTYASALMSNPKKAAPQDKPAPQTKAKPGMTKSSIKPAASKLPSHELRVKVRSNQSREDLLTECSELIRNSGTLSALRIISCRVTGGSITYRLLTEEDRDFLASALNDAGLLTSDTSISPEIAIAIPDAVGHWTAEELTDDVNKKNGVHTTPIRRTAKLLFCRCTPDEYRKLSTDGAFLGFSRSRCFLSLRVSKCFRCQKLGHLVAECPDTEQTCSKCSAKGHLAHKCTATELKCPTCNTPGHTSDEFRRCPSLKRAMDYRRSLMRLGNE